MRLESHGRNELVTDKAVPGWRRFFAQFRDVLVILLLVATAVSVGLWMLEGGAGLPYEAIAILAVVLLNATMGFIQESRAEAAVAALRSMSAADATVVRDGERRSVPAAHIVPGDVILVEEGDTIPADARLIDSTRLQAAEAALTGESLPVTKDASRIDQDVPLGDRENMIFSGTSVTYGHGKAVVTATGMLTEIGRIAGLLRETPDEPTPLRRELDRTGKVLAGVVVGITVEGDPTEGALLVAARRVGIQSSALDRRLPRVSEVPFSSERKLMSARHRDAEQNNRGIVFTKGP